MKESSLTNRYERGNRITDHRQAQKPVKPLRQAGEFEGQRRHLTPVDQTRQCGIRQDGTANVLSLP